jgi:hypothetical protein
MSDVHSGGPAFPTSGMMTLENKVTGEKSFIPQNYPGMSLRDWFAGQALAGIVVHTTEITAASIMAYKAADAMLLERDKP